MIEPPTKNNISLNEINRVCVFDVQSFSIHDGPGIRTVIFFKGCPLDCVWCHNPESKNKNPRVMFFKNNCAGCMACAKISGCGARIINSDAIHEMICSKRVEVCCYGALKICGKFYTPDALLDRIKSDIAFIKEYGGITFSGGEPLIYSDFICKFLDLLPDIHITVETSGSVSEKEIDKIINRVNLFLFDIKIVNSAEHKKYCGLINDSILSNLSYLYQKEKEIIIRLPVIPGINDTTQHFDDVTNLLKNYPKINKIEIMPYNNYGISKMEALGQKIPLILPLKNPASEIKDNWREEFSKRGFDIKVL